jgi:hypothetical protein
MAGPKLYATRAAFVNCDKQLRRLLEVSRRARFRP